MSNPYDRSSKAERAGLGARAVETSLRSIRAAKARGWGSLRIQAMMRVLLVVRAEVTRLFQASSTYPTSSPRGQEVHSVPILLFQVLLRLDFTQEGEVEASMASRN